MNKALITGISGFVGPYLKAELESHGYETAGFDKNPSPLALHCDITCAGDVQSAVRDTRPDVIFHLAGFSSVAGSFKEPELCRNINVGGTENLLNAVLAVKIRPKILIVSSTIVYGIPDYLPVDEKHPAKPNSPYGESKVEQEKLALSYDLPVIISRSFNHTGPGQSPEFVIPSFRKQVEETPDGGRIKVGNLDVMRDFSHVEDVVRAYRVLVERGRTGEIYNVGSGIPYQLDKILRFLIEESGKNLAIEKDPARFRPTDMPRMYADIHKLLALGGVSFRKMFYENSHS